MKQNIKKKVKSSLGFFLEVLGQEHPGVLEVKLLSLKGFSDLIITRDKSCENSEMRASSCRQREEFSVPISRDR